MPRSGCQIRLCAAPRRSDRMQLKYAPEGKGFSDSSDRLFVVDMAVFSAHQMEPLKALPVLLPAGDKIDPGGGNIAVAKDIRKLYHILRCAVERPREQMAQVVRKNLLRVHLRLSADRFHIRPDLFS